jgi:RNA polymerase sigma factor (sigma-70 family)
MSMVHQDAVNGPAAFICAQSGCRACQERLVRQHEGLVHAVIRRSWVGATAYDDLLQEGRMALWLAIRGFDVERGTTFSSYAWPIIERTVWRAVRGEERQRQAPPLARPEPPDPEMAGLATWQHEAVAAALAQALSHLELRARQVLMAAYGLEDQAPESLAAIGRRYGVSREAVRQWRNDALVLLRLPAICGPLARLNDEHDRQGHRRRQGLSQAWLRRRRGRQP